MRHPSALLLASVVVLGIYACDQQPVEPETSVPDLQLDGLQATRAQNSNPFLGSWIMTSAVVGNDELLAGTGIRYIMTFRSDGSHSVSISNDTEHLVCDPQTSCAWSGTYTHTGTTLTTTEPDHPDPDERGADTSAYVFCGGRLIFMDSGEGINGVRLTYKRTGQRR